MQRLGRSLIDSLRLAAQRVSSAAPASSSLLHDAAAVRAVEPQAAFARWNSTAAVASSSSTASATANAPRKTDPHHTLKRSLVPATSGRNAFHRGWAKRLQIKWNAQARKANTVAARKLQHEKHVALIKLRSQVAQAAKQQ